MSSSNNKDSKDRSESASNAFKTALFDSFLWITGITTPVIAASYWANKNIPSFTKLSPSAKVATPLMVALLILGIRLEKSAYVLGNTKQAWDWDTAIKVKTQDEFDEHKRKMIANQSLPIHKQAMHWLYTHPFAFTAMTGGPLVGFILYEQLKLKHLKFQQRIMHSRIFAQFGILSILLITMGFRHYMEKREPELVGFKKNDRSIDEVVESVIIDNANINKKHVN